MQPLASDSKIVRFGVFQVDLRSGELYKAGLKVKLQQQPLQVLALLLERPNDVVTREELRAKLWPTNTFVDFEHSLNTAVRKLRDALGDGADNPIFIETIPRKGYRFIAPLEVPASAGLGGLPTSARIPPPERFPVAAPAVATGNGKRTTVLVLGIVIVIGLVGMLGWKIVHDRRVAAGSAPQIRSLAVLPLTNLSGDPNQEYFADGMTEELTTDLGKISALRVISRTSAMQYKGTKKSLPEIARELNVDAVVEGTVARSGSHLRITANLLQTFPEKHLWAENYESEAGDALTLQGQIAQAVALQIQKTLRPEEAKGVGSQREISLDAYEAYWKGELLLDKLQPESVQEAADYFQEAIAKSPRFVAAYDKLAGAYGILGNMRVLTKKEAQSRTRAIIDKALQIDPIYGSAHAQKGWDAMDNELDLVTAGEEFKKAVELDPNGVEGHEGLGEYYAAVGKFDESILEMRRAQELDPLSFILNEDVCRMLFLARRYDEALVQCETTLDMDPSQRSRWQIAAIYVGKGMDEEAAATFLEAFEKAGVSPERMAALKSGAEKGGLKGLWREALRTNNPEVDREKRDCFVVARSYTYAGDKDKAITWLERAIEKRSFGIAYVRSDPTFDSFHSDVRFQNILQRIPITR